MNRISLRLLALAALLALAVPALVAADTVYYAKPGGKGIASITGTVQPENGSTVDVITADGRTVSISKHDVYQIVRDAPPAPKRPVAKPPVAADPAAGEPAAPTPAAAAAPVTAPTPAPTPAESTPMTVTTTAPPAAAPAPVRSIEDERLDALLAMHSPDRNPDAIVAPPRPARARHYGVKGGMNSSNLSVDPTALEDRGSLTSYAFGAWYGIPLNRRFTVQTEALYSVKGDAETSGGYTASTHVSYLDVPVLAKVGFLHGAPVQPALFVGPSLALNVSAKSKLEGEGNTLDMDIKDEVRNFDLGLVLGGGVDFSVGTHTCGVELRYSKGLTNAASDALAGSARNDVLAIMGSVGLE